MSCKIVENYIIQELYSNCHHSINCRSMPYEVKYSQENRIVLKYFQDN